MQLEAASTAEYAGALERALSVRDAGPRSRALARVCRFAPEAEVEPCAARALEAAELTTDDYQRAAAPAWTVRALVERGGHRKAAEALGLALQRAEEISHPVSRLHALFLLLQAGWPLDRKLRNADLSKLEAASAAANSWQAGVVQRDAALLLATEDPMAARRMAERMPEGRYRRQALRRLAAGETREPRPLFW